MTQSMTTPLKDIQQINYSIEGVAELSLFQDIDQKKTADNVRQFFKSDFPRIRRMALASADLQSPVSSDMPKGDVVGNTAETSIIKRVWAQKLSNDVFRAISACDHDSQIIIRSEALHGKRRVDIQEEVKYEHSQYFLKQREAYNQFADAFEIQDKGMDLHYYIKNKNGLSAD